MFRAFSFAIGMTFSATAMSAELLPPDTDFLKQAAELKSEEGLQRTIRDKEKQVETLITSKELLQETLSKHIYCWYGY